MTKMSFHKSKKIPLLIFIYLLDFYQIHGHILDMFACKVHTYVEATQKCPKPIEQTET